MDCAHAAAVDDPLDVVAVVVLRPNRSPRVAGLPLSDEARFVSTV